MNRRHSIIMEVARELASHNSPEHNDQFINHQLPEAAAAFIAHARGQKILAESTWPWAPRLWNPKTERGSLIEAAALLIAEIERRDRNLT